MLLTGLGFFLEAGQGDGLARCKFLLAFSRLLTKAGLSSGEASLKGLAKVWSKRESDREQHLVWLERTRRAAFWVSGEEV